jgi:hypothetical protein
MLETLHVGIYVMYASSGTLGETVMDVYCVLLFYMYLPSPASCLGLHILPRSHPFSVPMNIEDDIMNDACLRGRK